MAEWLAQSSFERNQGIVAAVVQSGQPLYVPNVRQESRYLPWSATTRSELCLPIRNKERLLGVIHVESSKQNAFDELDQRLWSAVAGEIAVGLEQLEAEQQERDLIVQEGRLQMARYLHDETAQQMYGLILSLKQALRQVAPGRAQTLLQETLDLAIQSWEDLRTYLQDLRSPLKQTSFSEILNQRGIEFNQLTGVPVHLEIEQPEPMFALETRTHLVAIVRAALGNVYRHAQATSVRLRLSQEEGEVVLEIEDDGVGFDVQHVRATYGSFGLIGIQEHAHSIGGRLQIESTPMKGTKVSVRLPLNVTQDAQERAKP